MVKDEEGKTNQKGGCGGLGKGNLSELFRSIEEYEKTLEAKTKVDAAGAWRVTFLLSFPYPVKITRY